MSNPVCESCRWWCEQDNQPGYGACKRYAPAVLCIGDIGKTAYPGTASDDFCGDWAAWPKVEPSDTPTRHIWVKEPCEQWQERISWTALSKRKYVVERDSFGRWAAYGEFNGGEYIKRLESKAKAQEWCLMQEQRAEEATKTPAPSEKCREVCPKVTYEEVEQAVSKHDPWTVAQINAVWELLKKKGLA